MSIWALLGGPQHGATESGPVPDGYQFEAAGSQYGPIYEPTVRQADEVYRWSVDVAYLADGERLLDAVQHGSIGFPEEVPTAVINHAFSALKVTLSVLRSNPDMEEAQMAVSRSTLGGICWTDGLPRQDHLDRTRADLARAGGLAAND